MLKFENIEPKMLAYDRPSPKFISFLKKHYQLADYIKQNNNFVVFNDYFEYIQTLKTNERLKSTYKNDYQNNLHGKSGNSLANVGQKLIENNNINAYNAYQFQNNFENNNNNSNQIKYQPTPDKIFSNYYLNIPNTNYYDHVYSKKKQNLLNDYMYNPNIKEVDEYVKY
jgi:hypothetical protein